MEIKSVFYWTYRIILILFLGSMVFLTGITVAIIVVRILPFARPLSANLSAVHSAPGAQFISAVYSPLASTAEANLIKRLKMTPLLPIFVATSILANSLKPVGHFFRKVFPRNNSQPSSGSIIADTVIMPDSPNPGPPSIDMAIPSISDSLGAEGGLSGIAPGDTFALERAKGKLLNLGFSFLFLLIVILCILMAASLFNYLIAAFNKQSKHALQGTIQLSEEIKALPSVIEEIREEIKPVVRKKTSTKKKK